MHTKREREMEEENGKEQSNGKHIVIDFQQYS